MSYVNRVKVVEPYRADLTSGFDGTGAKLIDIDEAPEDCGILLLLVDHDVFKAISAEERGQAVVYDTRGVWTFGAEGWPFCQTYSMRVKTTFLRAIGDLA